MVNIDAAWLSAWVAGLLLPLARILSLVAISPVFSHESVPARVKIGLGVLLSVIVAPTLPAIGGFDPLSLSGVMLIVEQIVVGLAMGFAMRIVFAAVELAGEVSGMTMGLGFATFFDPTTQGESMSLNQLLSLLTTLVFLAIDGHLILLATLVRSFHDMPLDGAQHAPAAFWRIAQWGGHVFAAGVQLSLPIVAALLITNIALGIHLFHGVWSLFQSMGWNNPKFKEWRRHISVAFATIIVVGNVSFPIAVLAGIVGK